MNFISSHIGPEVLVSASDSFGWKALSAVPHQEDLPAGDHPALGKRIVDFIKMRSLYIGSFVMSKLALICEIAWAVLMLIAAAFAGFSHDLTLAAKQSVVKAASSFLSAIISLVGFILPNTAKGVIEEMPKHFTNLLSNKVQRIAAAYLNASRCRGVDWRAGGMLITTISNELSRQNSGSNGSDFQLAPTEEERRVAKEFFMTHSLADRMRMLRIAADLEGRLSNPEGVH